MYYELLWGGYPLIHNSPFVGDCGYFYPDFDCEKGGAAILDALKHHDENFSEYRRKATAYLETVSPHNPQNIEIYDQAIVALFEKD